MKRNWLIFGSFPKPLIDVTVCSFPFWKIFFLGNFFSSPSVASGEVRCLEFFKSSTVWASLTRRVSVKWEIWVVTVIRVYENFLSLFEISSGTNSSRLSYRPLNGMEFLWNLKRIFTNDASTVTDHWYMIILTKNINYLVNIAEPFTPFPKRYSLFLGWFFVHLTVSRLFL